MGVKDWSPKGRLRSVEELQQMAVNIVGDGRRPNIFFVSVAGMITVITLEFTVAYRAWKAYAAGGDMETALEDRLTGVIASVAPEEDDSDTLIRIDDSAHFEYR